MRHILRVIAATDGSDHEAEVLSWAQSLLNLDIAWSVFDRRITSRCSHPGYPEEQREQDDLTPLVDVYLLCKAALLLGQLKPDMQVRLA